MAQVGKKKFWLSLVSVMETDQLLDLARFAEELGFYGITMADHLVMPAKIESKYPYTPDGEVFWPEDTPWADPWVTLAAMGAVTRKLMLASNIYLAAVRDPFTAAKAVSTAAVLTNDRIICGVSAGWIKEEYVLLGVEFASRGQRLDDLLAAMRKLWTGKVVSHRGPFFNFDAIMCPAPRKPIPIVCGGGAPAAVRRAAMNDGWLPLPMPLAQFGGAVNAIRKQRTDAGLSLDGFQIIYAPAEPVTPGLIEGVDKLGLDQLLVICPWIQSPWDVEKWMRDGDDPSKLDSKKRAMENYAERVIRKFG